MWILFFLPWAATCINKKVGFHVTLGFVWLHYTFKRQTIDAITKLSHSMIKRAHHATQTKADRKAESSIKTEFEKSPSKMETDESPSSCPSYARGPPSEETVTILGYDYNMYAVKTARENMTGLEMSPMRRQQALGTGPCYAKKTLGSMP